MTKITRVTIRETDIEYRGDKLVVQLLPKKLYIWPKGKPKESVSVSWEKIRELGEKDAARRKG